MKTLAQKIWDEFTYEEQKAVMREAAFQFFVEHQKKILENNLIEIRNNKNSATEPDLNLTVKPTPNP